jgi:F-type H+-transporting ATPase subunit b
VSITTVLAAEEVGGEGHGGFWANAYPIIPHPGELLFGLIAVAVLYYVVNTYVVPRLEQIFAERAAAIEGGMAKAEAVQAEAAATREEYLLKLAEARQERARIIAEAEREAALAAEEIRQRAAEEAQRITAAASQQIQAERQHALIQLRAEVGALAVDLASRIVGESLESEARQHAMVDRFLDELDTAPSGLVS